MEAFQIEPLAQGVYAAIAVMGKGSLCNAGIVDLGDRTLVFDTLRTPAAAEELREAARLLTGRAATWVVNSHWHDDHVAGNQVFAPEATIMATGQTRELMATRLVEEYAQDAQGIGPFMKSLEERLAAAKDERERDDLRTRLEENRRYADALPSIRVTLPEVTFESRLVFNGTTRAAEALSFGGGHTASDAFLYLPEEGIAFMGDLAFLNVHPWLPDGDPEEWIRILERTEQLPLRVVVPGHGPVGDARSLALTREYIAALLDLAREPAEAGDGTESVGRQAPAQFAGWEVPQFFDVNMRFLRERASAGR